MDNGTQKERLYALLNEMHYSQARFEDEIGMSHGSVAHMSNFISANMMRKIKARFPQVNSAWLLSGTGDMFAAEKDKEPQVSPERQHLLDEIAAQRVILEKLIKQQDKISDNVAACQSTIQMLSERL